MTEVITYEFHGKTRTIKGGQKKTDPSFRLFSDNGTTSLRNLNLLRFRNKKEAIADLTGIPKNKDLSGSFGGYMVILTDDNILKITAFDESLRNGRGKPKSPKSLVEKQLRCDIAAYMSDPGRGKPAIKTYGTEVFTHVFGLVKKHVSQQVTRIAKSLPIKTYNVIFTDVNGIKQEDVDDFVFLVRNTSWNLPDGVESIDKIITYTP